MLFILGFTGVFLAITPLLVKHSEVFAVTVPSAAYDEPEIRRLRTRYMTITLIATALMMIASAASWSISENVFVWVFTGAVLLLIMVAFVLYLVVRAQVIKLKAERGWDEDARAEVSAVIVEPAAVKRPPSMYWNLLYVVIVAATLVIGLALYPHMPALVPTHSDFAGNVTNYVPKSRTLLFYTPFIQVFLAVIMAFVFWVMRRARRDIDPLHPQASAQRAALFVWIQSIFILLFGLVLTASMAAIQLSFVGALPIDTAGFIVITACVSMMFVLTFISLRYGQSGARLAPRAEDALQIARDDDRFWKLGVLYYNPDDPALFVPKRFGVGWTNNFACPGTWLLAGGLAVLCGVLVWGSMLLVK
jgi:uncharacterized membrane protein